MEMEAGKVARMFVLLALIQTVSSTTAFSFARDEDSELSNEQDKKPPVDGAAPVILPRTFCSHSSNPGKCFNRFRDYFVRTFNSQEAQGKGVRNNGEPISNTNWKLLCPGIRTREECVAIYRSLSLANTHSATKYKSKFKKVQSGDVAQEMPAKRYFSKKLCPDSVKKLDCFATYIGRWLKHMNQVGDIYRRRASWLEFRRNRLHTVIPGKRSQNHPLYFQELLDFCPLDGDIGPCYSAYRSLFDMSSHTEDLQNNDGFQENSLEIPYDPEAVRNKIMDPLLVSKDPIFELDSSGALHKFMRDCSNNKTCLLQGIVGKPGPISEYVSNMSHVITKRSTRPYTSLCPSGIAVKDCFDQYLVSFAGKISQLRSRTGRNYFGFVRKKRSA